MVDGRRADNFSANNYLGLADRPDLIERAIAAMRHEGFGAGASRLIVGNLAAHRRLEQRIAAWKGTEAALLFNSGYQANLGAVASLVGPGDAIYSDELNHASLIDGARLSRAEIFVYPHRDVGTLERLLAESGRYRRRLVVTDSVFSMDGDRAPLDEVVALAQRADALTLVDEAHASGVFGEAGTGLCGRLPVDLQMGTLGKALGGFGAFIAGSGEMVEWLVNRARSFVFTTALPVPVVAWAEAAIDLVASTEGESLRARLDDRCRQLARGLARRGFGAREPSHIAPLLVGDAGLAMRLSEALLERGTFVQGIRPPTVPEGTSRLRFALMATHEPTQIEHALEGLAAVEVPRPPTASQQ